jgi:endonuclease YncB( thermonuclease family)
MNMKARLALISALIAGISTVTLAATLSGKVVGITDGDTITVLDGQQTQHKIRLMGIDSPEKTQPVGQDANLEQVRKGMAWHYKKYQNEQEPIDRAAYSQAEIEARMGHRGLWSDPTPIPPWDWRKSKSN